ncbi:FHIPEP family type III secretion protein, partial [Hydrogenovibrio sp. 3SP14C1]
PGLADTLMNQAQQALEKHEGSGEAPVLVVQHSLRAVLSRFLRRRMRHLVVMSQAEIPDDRTLRVTTLVGGR